MRPAVRLQEHHRAALYMSLSALFFSLSSVSVKLLPAGIPLGHKITARALLGVLVSLALMRRGRAGWRPGNAPLLGLRIALGAAGLVTYYIGIEGLPLAEAVTLNLLSPFWVILLADLFLGERISPAQGLAVALGFAGAAVIVAPGRLGLSAATLAGFTSAFFSGAAYTGLRALRRTDRPETIVFWFSLVLLAGFGPPAAWRGPAPDWLALALLAGIGLGAALGQLAMTAAFQHAPGGEVAIYSYLHVIFSLLWQALLWRDLPRFSALAGVGLVMLGAVCNVRGRRSPTAAVPA